MTSRDDSASATAGKGAFEPAPDSPFCLDQLNRLVFLDPDAEALLRLIGSMTSGDDSVSTTAGKGAAEPVSKWPFLLDQLRLDLLDPGAEALAFRIIDRLYSGDLIAYGRPYGTDPHQKSAVPTADW